MLLQTLKYFERNMINILLFWKIKQSLVYNQRDSEMTMSVRILPMYIHTCPIYKSLFKLNTNNILIKLL